MSTKIFSILLLFLSVLLVSCEENLVGKEAVKNSENVQECNGKNILEQCAQHIEYIE